MTFKSGPFVFSTVYSNEKLLKLQIESTLLYQTVNDLPVLPKIAAQLQRDLIKRSIFSTAAIEGNPLTREKTEEIIESNESDEKQDNSTKEIKNLVKAYQLIQQVEKQKTSIRLSENLIKKFHSIITNGIDYDGNTPGKYRTHIVKVGDAKHGGVYTPPKIQKDIQMLMKEFITFINSEEVAELDPIIRAALAHYYLALIHPFGDGNGRTARIIEAYLLSAAGIKYVPPMLSNFYYRNMDGYYLAFSRTRKDKNHEVTPFLEFIFTGFIESLKELKGILTHHIRVLALRDYFHFLKQEKKITQRQFDFLMTLLEQPFEGITFKELFQRAPFNVIYRQVSPSSARRDLKKLSELNLISPDKNGKYTLNYEALT